MQSIFFNMVGMSITVSIVVIILLLLSSFFKERYTAKWSCFIWLILAIRLLIPFDFGFTSPPVELKLSDRELIYGVDETEFSELALPELGVSENINATPEQKEAYENDLKKYNTEILAAKKATGKTITISQIISGIYLIGIVIFFLLQFGIYFSFRLSTRRWYCEVNPQTLKTLERLKLEMELIKPLRIKVCKKISSPMIVGLIKPTLLLPHEGYQNIDLEVILKHELVHFKRNDLWFKLLLLCANALHWFNPVIYRMVTEANKDIEMSCDEEVLKGADTSVRKRYSKRILDLMQGNHHPGTPISTRFHGGKGMIKSRIRHIFDERAKKKGVLSFFTVLILVLAFSACRFGIGQAYWQIPISREIVDAYGFDAEGNRNSEMPDFTIPLSFDRNQNGKEDTTFSLIVSEEGKNCTLKYQNADGSTVKTRVFENVEPGFDYGIQAANLEDWNTVMIIVSIDYRGMPFGSGYWEIYTWKNTWKGGSFERVDLNSVEENLMTRILKPEEARNNVMGAGVITYLYDSDQYPVDYPVAALSFKDELKKDGTLGGIIYAPMSEYDVEGFQNWGQEAVGKMITGMNFVAGSNVEGWEDPSRALLETNEVVYITLPNITATVTRYYQYQDGKWNYVDRMIE